MAKRNDRHVKAIVSLEGQLTMRVLVPQSLVA